MSDFSRAAVRPLKHFADFRGRSTRTEVVAFYVLIQGSILVASLAASLVDDPGRSGTIRGVEVDAVVGLIFLLPLLALMTRRMHDQGRSAWVLLAAATPLLAAGAWKFARTGGEFPIHVRAEELPVLAAIIVFLSWLAFLVLLFLKNDEDANRYGPNPRYDEPAQIEPPGQMAMQRARP
ncbi:MAG TPA: DUF805 domain-containing protein [Allosphingosinicella sp.]|nr:DUF805 domain-containing protein [Allosphingosinicella sp.]